MRVRRTVPIILAVAIIAAAIVLAIELRKNAPPEPARLLPGADAFVYANLGWLRKANGGKPLPAVSHDPDFERFIQETGFEFERDLDSVAFAVHYPAKWRGGGTGGDAPEPRYSEVFIGKYNGERLAGYLHKIAHSVESYKSVDVYTIPIETRNVRVAILGVDTVAASNNDNPAVIRGIIDRYRRLASPFGGPALLRKYYKDVQFASPVWAIARVTPEISVGGWSAVIDQPADVVISTSANPLHLPLHPGAIHVRAEAFTETEEDARTIAEKLQVFVAMFHSADTSVGTPGTDSDVKAVFDSMQVKQADKHAVLSATLPPGFIKKLMNEPPPQPPQENPATTPMPAPSQSR